MELIRFRKANKLSLSDLAKLLGLSPSTTGNLSKIERGEHVPTPQLVDQIWWVTQDIGPGAVTVLDHHRAWQRAHPQEYRAIRAASRAAVTAFQKRQPKEGNNGEEGK